MGNSVSGSKERHIDDSVDYGSLSPQGVYTGAQDWNQQVVGHLIVDRKLAPFYKPLEDYDDAWDDDHILAARKPAPNPPPPPPESPASPSSKFHHHKHSNKSGKEPFRPTEASVYRGALECPICFLYYPPNINRSRCCDQAICTECFVQIKRAEPTTTHLVSEPASCPYCVQDNFGVTYDPPPWRSGLVRDGQPPPTPTRPDTHKTSSASSADSEGLKRRKSFGPDSPEVVTIDQIRPDWEAKLAAVRAAVTRRANRRIIMRQVGDRLIPIGVSSGRMVDTSDAPANADGPEGATARRRRRAHPGQDLNQILGTVGLGGLGGQDLEELMVMEAMRLSLMEHEEQQRRQNSNNDTSSAPSASNTNGNSVSPAPSPSPSPRTSLPVPIDPPTLRPRSPSPRQSPSRSRICLTSSPLGSPGTAAPGAQSPQPSQPLQPSQPSQPLQPSQPSQPLQPSLAPPPSGRTHRRTGSSPDPPSGGTLAAALSAAQTASALVGMAEGRPGAALLARSAPQTRAASPSPSLSESGVESGWSGLPPSVVVVRPSEGPSGGMETSNMLATGSGTGLDTLDVVPAALATTPVMDGEAEGASSRDAAEYRTLASSIESSEPLLGWDKQ